MKTINNRVLRSELVSWKTFEFIQPEKFKSLNKADYRKLRTSILNNEFVESFKVWEECVTGKIYCLDGYHRCLVLRELENEGFDVMEKYQADFLDCKNRKEAAKLVAIYSSQYAKVTEEGMNQFIIDADLDIDELSLEINIPGISLKDLRTSKEEYDNENCVYPIVPVMSEKYDFVIIFADNEIDFTWLRTILKLKEMKSYKSKQVGEAHVIPAKEFQKLWTLK